MNKKIVYISSPYTGDEENNAEFSMRIFSALMYTSLIVPVAPLMLHYWPGHMALSYDEIMDYDLYLLSRCDAIAFFAPTFSERQKREYSRGMTMEKNFADEHSIPQFGIDLTITKTINDLIVWSKK